MSVFVFMHVFIRIRKKICGQTWTMFAKNFLDTNNVCNNFEETSDGHGQKNIHAVDTLMAA